jgi:hypothetical protein
MQLILVLIILFFPRFGLVLLALFSDWFATAGLGLFSLLLGFLFAPVTLLWYSFVMNIFHGQWGIVQVLILILALMADFGSGYGGYRHHHRYYVVED